ncbi:CoA-transferase [Streptomyces sp. NPDC005070]
MRPDDLAATALTGLPAKVPDLDRAAIGDAVWGNANDAGEDNRNVGRMAVLLAGLPVSVPVTTVNRSFAMKRGGHLDVCVLGAFQVSYRGDLANWHTGDAEVIPAVGGAMDLAVGARRVLVMMKLFTRDGAPLLVPACAYPLTAAGCVSLVFTDYGVFEPGPDGLRVRETYGITVAELGERFGIDLVV